MFLDRLGIPQFFTSISCVLLSFATKPHLPLTGQIRNMAQIASMTGAMGHLSLYRSCRPVRMGPSNGSISRTCMRASDSYHVEVKTYSFGGIYQAPLRCRNKLMLADTVHSPRSPGELPETPQTLARLRLFLSCRITRTLISLLTDCADCAGRDRTRRQRNASI
jgi:hypothetical protein